MRFVKGGPDLPEELLDAQQSGKLVFFCGAGISCNAGFPMFSGLTKKLFDLAGVSPKGKVEELVSAGAYEDALQYLEREHCNGPMAVRKWLKKIFDLEIAWKEHLSANKNASGKNQESEPEIWVDNAFRAHRSLLRLAASGEGRLVTTNYDFMFDQAAGSLHWDKDRSCWCWDRESVRPFHAAPKFPVAKPERWKGLVYLHGKLPKADESSPGSLNDLVLTSSDYGRAYLTEGWASRFVTELFANFDVCFIGYSAGDKVISYILDAVSAERNYGRKTGRIWAFDSDGKLSESWSNKGVRPIAYNSDADNDCPNELKHRLLNETLEHWAGWDAGGLDRRCADVARLARYSFPPEGVMVDSAISSESREIKRELLWCLSERTGRAAEVFADLDPPASLSWLFVFSQEKLNASCLRNLGIQQSEDEDRSSWWTLLHRPQPGGNRLISRSKNPLQRFILSSDGRLDDPIDKALSRWLLQYVKEELLVLWAVKCPALVPANFRVDLQRLFKTVKPSEKGNIALWRLWLQGRFYQGEQLDIGLDKLLSDLAGESVSLSSRRERVDYFKPLVTLEEKHAAGSRITLTAHLRFSCGQSLHHLLYSFVPSPDNSILALRKSVDDGEVPLKIRSALEQALRETEEIAALLHLPGDFTWEIREFPQSVSDHRVDFGTSGISPLIWMLRDAWLQALYRDLRNKTHHSRLMVESWFEEEGFVFKRIALYAATVAPRCIIDSEIWLDWLLRENGRWFYYPPLRREVLHLLKLKGCELDEGHWKQLMDVVCSGPADEEARAWYESDRIENAHAGEELKEILFRQRTVSRQTGQQRDDLLRHDAMNMDLSVFLEKYRKYDDEHPVPENEFNYSEFWQFRRAEFRRKSNLQFWEDLPCEFAKWLNEHKDDPCGSELYHFASACNTDAEYIMGEIISMIKKQHKLPAKFISERYEFMASQRDADKIYLLGLLSDFEIKELSQIEYTVFKILDSFKQKTNPRIPNARVLLSKMLQASVTPYSHVPIYSRKHGITSIINECSSHHSCFYVISLRYLERAFLTSVLGKIEEPDAVKEIDNELSGLFSKPREKKYCLARIALSSLYFGLKQDGLLKTYSSLKNLLLGKSDETLIIWQVLIRTGEVEHNWFSDEITDQLKKKFFSLMNKYRDTSRKDWEEDIYRYAYCLCSLTMKDGSVLNQDMKEIFVEGGESAYQAFLECMKDHVAGIELKDEFVKNYVVPLWNKIAQNSKEVVTTPNKHTLNTLLALTGQSTANVFKTWLYGYTEDDWHDLRDKVYVSGTDVLWVDDFRKTVTGI